MVSTSSTVGDIPTPILLAGAFAGVLVIGVALFLWKSGGSKKPAPLKEIPRKVLETFDEDEEDDTKRVTVFFGSQTGTAEGFAKNLADEGKARYEGRVDFKLVDLDDYAEEDEIYEQKLKKEKLAIFVLATYGDGEPTDNASRFYKWFAEILEAEAEEKGAWLSNLQFCSFGLGNRQYEHFNKVARVVDEALERYGAKRIVEMGLGDDDQCIEDDFNAWRELLWPGMDLLVRDPYDETPGTPMSYTVAIPEYRVVVHDVGTPVRVESYATRRNGNTVVDALHPIRSNVAVRKELHLAASDRACTHLEFDITNSGLTYETGDHVGVFTQNYQQNVEDMADILGYSLDTIISLHSDDKMGDPIPSASSLPAPIPGPLALQTALSRYADLLTPPKKAVINTLASFASNPEQAERLKFLASPNGKDEYNQYISIPQRTLLEVLSDFDSVKVPLGVFFAAVSARLSPRFYSISSSPKMHPNRIHVTCALVQGPSASGKIYRGVCSTWMKHAVPVEAGSTDISWAPIFVRTSTFRLPVDPKTPIVMVGPGTGLAPFRGFLQERSALLDAGETLGPALFFFGCRTRKEDYIYEEELAYYKEKGVLSKLILAFSREGSEKEYVQHKMKQEAEAIWNIVSQGGHFYICGDAKSMARDVNKELHNIMIEQGGLDSTRAEAMAKQMQVDGRYQRDIW